jgi:hypothetical protein
VVVVAAGSVHRRSWPTRAEVLRESAVSDETPRVSCSRRTQARLADVRRIKAIEKRPVKAVITKAVLPHDLEALRPATRDFQAAAHVRDLSSGAVRRAGGVRGGRAREWSAGVSARRAAAGAGGLSGHRPGGLAEDIGGRRRHHERDGRSAQRAQAVLVAKTRCVVAGSSRRRSVSPARCAGRDRPAA